MTIATTAASTDRIERKIHIKAPRSKVWRSLSDAEQFGNWFGAALNGKTFTSGQRVEAKMTIKGCEHIMFDVIPERIEPESLMSYRWHPYTAGDEYSGEERTLVTFTLKEVDDGTLLTVVESGFDKIPPARRLRAFASNSNGWEAQLKNIADYASAG
ncbi:MAG: SRPBCC family protein [Pseudomonadota bacterium]